MDYAKVKLPKFKDIDSNNLSMDNIITSSLTIEEIARFNYISSLNPKDREKAKRIPRYIRNR